VEEDPPIKAAHVGNSKHHGRASEPISFGHSPDLGKFQEASLLVVFIYPGPGADGTGRYTSRQRRNIDSHPTTTVTGIRTT
jgi:hypothetical protein